MAEHNKILVIGELNVDLIATGLSAYPTLGKEVIVEDFHIVLGSSSAICAAGLAKLGTEVDFIGKVGDDHYGTFILEELRRLGVGTDHIIRDRETPTGATISLVHQDDRALITYLGSIAALRAEEIDTELLKKYQHVHVSSYFLQQRLQPGLPELFREAHRAGLTTSLDTGYDPAEQWGGDHLKTVLRETDIFLPNWDEARAITGAEERAEVAQRLSEITRLAVIKCGADGALTFDQGQLIHVPGFHVDAVDTTGAGDSFDAGFLFATIVRRLPLKEALRFANACGALSTTGIGGTAAQPTADEVELLLRRYPPTST